MRGMSLAKKFVVLMGGGADIWWAMRDLFTTDIAAGSLNNTAAEPGTATRLVTDVESRIFTVEDWLRGGAQETSAVWGESKIVWSPALARTPGRCLVCMVRPADTNQDLAIGWASANDIADARIDGHGWLHENGLLEAIVPGKTVKFSNDLHDIRPLIYLVGTVLCTTGAYTFLSLYDEDTTGIYGNIWPLSKPKYPTALIINATKTGTTDPMFPYVSYFDDTVGPYYRGHAIKDMRAVDLGADYDMAGLAILDDDFTRADSNTAMGNDWAPDIGVWGISSNAAYCVSGSGFRNTWKSTVSRDGIYIWRVTTPAANTNFELCLSRVSAGNYLRMECSMAGNTIKLQYMNGGAYAGEIFALTQALVENTTYQIALSVYGNKYYLVVNDVSINGAYTWPTDAGNNHITGTGIGIGAVNNGTTDGALFLDVTVLPLTFTLPDEIALGAVPILPTVAGATIAQDTFTDDDATALADHTAEAGGAWTVVNGTWLINSNVLQVDTDSGADGGEARAYQDLGVQNVECTLEITTPAAWSETDDLRMGEGIIGRYIDANHFIGFRCRADVDQPTECEVELVIANGAGTAQVGGKTYISDIETDVYAVNTKYTLRVIFSGDMAYCYLDDHLVMNYVIPEGVSGTKFGVTQMFGAALEDQAVRATMDNWSAKAL